MGVAQPPYYIIAKNCPKSGFAQNRPTKRLNHMGRLSGIRRAPIDRICHGSAQNPASTRAAPAQNEHVWE
jgi:hypothetical protein